MATPAISINRFFIDQISVRTREDFKSESPVFSQIGSELMVGHVNDEPNVFLVRLGLRFHTEGVEERANLPYDVSIAVRGFFQAPDAVTPFQIPSHFVLNALNILYGIARGHVAQTTGTGPHGPMTLPAVTFNDLVERAARTEGTGIEPAAEMLNGNEPGAKDFFRFTFAVEDLPALIRTMSETDIQAELLIEHQQLVLALNETPIQKAQTEARVVVSRMVKRLENLQSPGASVVRPALASIISILDKLGRKLDVKRDALTLNLKTGLLSPTGEVNAKHSTQRTTNQSAKARRDGRRHSKKK